MTKALHTKYRPIKFKEVIGQGSVIKALEQVIQDRSSQAFLFCGPAGTGKTTLARITAEELNIADGNTLEIDAATNTGVDDMRKIQEMLGYRAFGKYGNRGILIDECHRLSRNAWDSLLKSVEEPPTHITWFFCTTEPGKVPVTIKTRCTTLTLKLVPDDELKDLVRDICDVEQIKLLDGIDSIIVKESAGSPRQALVNLALVRGVTNRKEAAEILRSAQESDPALGLIKYLLDGRGSWIKAMGYLEQLQEENPESIRIVICNYLGGCLRNAKNDQEATHFLTVLDAFSDSYNPSEGQSPLMQSIGRVLFAE